MLSKYSQLCTGLLLSVTLLTPNLSTATPDISTVTGDITTDTTLTINGSLFTAKTRAKPLFWWKADFGINTPSSLGNKTSWDGTVGGNISTTVVAPGSQQSIAFDHGASSSAALGRIDFSSNRIYLHRKTFDDFDITEDFAIRTRVNLSTGTLNVGDTVVGASSGATGVIQRIETESSPGSTHAIFYEKTGGTVNNSPSTDFTFDETKTSSSAAMTNTEGSAVFPTGTLKSFNFKIVRFWSSLGTTNNIYMSAQGTDSNPGFNITPENTQGIILNKNFTNPLFQITDAWKVEEIEYETSSLDIADGTFNVYQNGTLGTGQKVNTRSTAFPDPYAVIFQSQVSNGAQPGSIMYYDSLYVDDTWHRVVICRGRIWSACDRSEVQIPTAWSDNQITVSLNLGGFNSKSSLFLYVVDENGDANPDGYALCPLCPLPPTP